MHMSVLTNGRHVNVPVGCDMVLMIPSQTGLRLMDPSNVPMTCSEIHFMEPSNSASVLKKCHTANVLLYISEALTQIIL